MSNRPSGDRTRRRKGTANGANGREFLKREWVLRDMADLIYKEEAYKIIGACMEVYNILGPGFLESVYQEALALEFDERGIPYQPECPIRIHFKGRILKKRFSADFLCYEDIILEIKAVETIIKGHEGQLLNYLRGSQKPLGLLVNFGASTFQYRRFANTRKK